MKKRIIFFAALLALSAGTVCAQYNETNNLFYFSQRSSQTNMLNPALMPKASFYLQLPSTGFRLGLPLSVSDIVKYNPDEQRSVINVTDVLHQLGENNKFRNGIDIDMLGFGFKVNNLFFNFNSRLVMNTEFGIPVEVVNGILQGNMDGDTPIQEVQLLKGDLFNMQAYLENSLGAGYKISPINLTVGAHVKLLSGLFNITTNETNVTLETSEDGDEVVAHVYYKIQEAAAIPISQNDEGNPDFGQTISDIPSHIGQHITNLIDPFKGNTGVAFDLGARWDLGGLTVTASINDLTSGIHWRNNINTFEPKGGSGDFRFSGVEINNMMNGGSINSDSIAAHFTEQLNNLMPQFVIDDQNGAYTFAIPTKMNLGVSYTFLRVFRAGLLFHGQFDKGITRLNLIKDNMNTFRFNTTLSAGVNLFNWAELLVASSVVNDGDKMNFFNPGVGLVFTPGTVLQTYVMVDYLSSIYATQVKAANVKFGMSVIIGRK